jgi:hypothetical protein
MNIQLEKYSEKSIAIFGEDTKLIKDELLELGGKYNPNLKGDGETKRAGWIFPLIKEENVKKLIESSKLKSHSVPVDKKIPIKNTDSNMISALLSRIELLEIEVTNMKRILLKKNPVEEVIIDDSSEDEKPVKGLIRSLKQKK